MAEFEGENSWQANQPEHESPAGSSAADSSSPTSAASSDDEIAAIISDVINRRTRGERISNEEIIAAHPELMPGLLEDLLALDAIQRATLMAQKPGEIDSLDGDNTQNAMGEFDEPEPEDEYEVAKIVRIEGYAIEREISSGGQATVFKALQERTGRTVAVKVIHGGPFVGSRGRKRFERESKILARLQHPNIVGILDRGRTADGSFYLVMDFIEGLDLDSYMQEVGKNAETIVRLFVRIAPHPRLCSPNGNHSS